MNPVIMHLHCFQDKQHNILLFVSLSSWPILWGISRGVRCLLHTLEATCTVINFSLFALASFFYKLLKNSMSVSEVTDWLFFVLFWRNVLSRPFVKRKYSKVSLLLSYVCKSALCMVSNEIQCTMDPEQKHWIMEV